MLNEAGEGNFASFYVSKDCKKWFWKVCEFIRGYLSFKDSDVVTKSNNINARKAKLALWLAIIIIVLVFLRVVKVNNIYRNFLLSDESWVKIQAVFLQS